MPRDLRLLAVVVLALAACDGGNGALGHPRVFLEMGEGTEVTCPYCDRLFVLDGDGH